MTKLDRALVTFRTSTNRNPKVIYLGWNVLNEVRMSAFPWNQLDLAKKTYQGIPFYRVANEDDHLAIY